MRIPGNLLIFTIAACLFFSGCNYSAKRQERLKEELIEVDREFSELSSKIGSHGAFLNYLDDSCVLLRPNRNPIIGRQAIQSIYNNSDTSYVLTWEPLAADVARSGDLGYTYGIFTIKMDSPTGEKVEKQGTYASVWKKDKTGNWKFVLDTGNQGLGPQTSEQE